jgi:hypothetical protein
MVVKVVGKKLNQRQPKRKNSELPKKILRKKKKKKTFGAQFHPIHEIAKQDFLVTQALI